MKRVIFGVLCGTSIGASLGLLTAQQPESHPNAGAALGAPAPAATPPANVQASGDPAAGATLFFGRAGCANCHDVNGRGGIAGPDLSGIARHGAELLRQKIVNPSISLPLAGVGAPGGGGRGGGRGAAGPVTVVVRIQDGRELRGVRRAEDTFSLQMIDQDGTLQLLDKRTVASVTTEPRSPMPSDYATQLSADDIDNVVAYLRMLTGRDLSKTATLPMAPGGVTAARLRASKSEPQNWLMYWGDYYGTHSSPLSRITTANVRTLRAVWSAPVPSTPSLETTPIVVDGVMYVTSGGDPLTVTALDARAGRQIWRVTRAQKTKNPFGNNPHNRGVSVLGNRLYVGTLDCALLSLDARTGAVMWEVPVGDVMEGYSITSPPLIVGTKVIVGIAGGEFPIRGFIQAFDAASGKSLWKFHTIPGPGEFGNDTWKGDSWKVGGGATWLTGTYDPELNLVYWPIGNPAAQRDRSARGELDNLFSDSVVALDADTGVRKWHYQFTPNDGHDWDSTEDVMLVDRVWRGTPRKLLLHADRNGHFYVLDRVDGTFLGAWPFVYQNWNKGFDEKGRPMPVPGSNSSDEGSFFVYPTLTGGTNFQAPSYSQQTGWFYLSYSENGQQYVSAPAGAPARGRQYIGGGAVAQRANRGPGEPLPNSGVKALDPETGKTMWDFKTYQGSSSNGVLATAGGLVFASIADGNIAALDAKTGKALWHYQTGAANRASPMSYAVDGRQYIALASGTSVLSFALPE